MRTELPEWTSTTPAPAVRVTEHGPAPVLMKAGTVQGLSDGPRIAVAIDDEMFILPPATVARIKGALDRALLEVAATSANQQLGGQLRHVARHR